MTLLTPKGAAALRWSAHRQRRARRVPLQRFLHARAIPLAPPGPRCVTDDLASAALYFVERALQAHHCRPATMPLQDRCLGALTCAVNVGLARSIGEEPSWYVASLVGVGVLLAPRRGISQGATLAARIAADYRDALGRGADHAAISNAAAEALRSNHENRVTRTVLEIMDVLCQPDAQPLDAAPDAGRAHSRR